MKSTILIVEDHELIADSLRMLINYEKDLKVVGIAHTEEEAIFTFQKKSPDFILMDLNLKEGSGLSATKKILKINKNTNIIGLSVNAEKNSIKTLLNMGAKGYVTKNSPKSELYKAIRTIRNKGSWYICEEVSEKLGEIPVVEKIVNKDKSIGHLTKREIEILGYIIQGLTNKEISKQLNVSSRTIETHRHNMIKRLSAKSIKGVIEWAQKNGVIN